ncbi:hypothetical protein KBB96_04370 [Luteolibacter ambystomatis]|uniref:DUF6916 domain-containing protein n=1 Tax=Luteolibacter ambystomatis TaxID=2824561 RepID=A0A975J199_9BACT|nr:hypothetical protein [Luteolibacter ambystomatis]QUE52129.1 hypothetical protein KBB96_04370 [Luteolibacter ambystomatis]
MIPLNELDQNLFLPHVGETFEILEEGRVYPLVLESVRDLGHRRPDAKRNPFSLSFRGSPGLRVPQRIYQLTHPELGTFEIFLTQNSATSEGTELEAVFN